MAADRALAQRVDALAQAVVAPHDLVVEKVDVRRRSGARVVVVTLDLREGPGSLDLDRLGDLSREISAALDGADAVPGAYTLEVTTPGVGRPLTQPRHFSRATGRLIEARLRDGARVLGRVSGAEPQPDGSVTLEVAGSPRTVAYADIADATVQVELRRVKEDD
ncbi:ribosome maturation factor RimP [Serinibacter salmoneus]|uniref:Ribosome maturation factor RimP n=1 Tax=Serinibacter salmoneus TaxID=556530 RepID=A0A2A9D0G8_9MICO|nr:hypothetical protein [Serinibacter salmoneus]PFG19330.1 ribosome maturation factor RimP [Serinibacter salmoneus]